MIVAIHQPNLFPRLKILQKLALADIWIVLDNVQYCQREYQNRTLIVPKEKKAFWCTIPVHLPFGQSTKINQVEFADGNSAEKVGRMLKYNLTDNNQNVLHYKEITAKMDCYSNNFVDFTVASTTALLDIVDIRPKVIYASQLGATRTEKNERLVDLCKAVGGNTYIADSGGANYINENIFYNNGLTLLWHVWETPQVKSALLLKDTIRNSSSVNLLMRSEQDFIDAVAQSKVSRKRLYAEGR